MAFVGNLLWFVLGGGIFSGLMWLLMGAIFAVTIVGLPFSMAAFRIAAFSAFPFGRELIDGRLLGKDRMAGTGFVNFLWCFLAGFWLALFHALAGVGLCISVVGIPFGLAHFKLSQVSFAPLGKVIVRSDVAKLARARSAAAQIDQLQAANSSDGNVQPVTRPVAAPGAEAGASGRMTAIPVDPPRDPMAEVLADKRLKELLLEMPTEKLQAIIDARSIRDPR